VDKWEAREKGYKIGRRVGLRWREERDILKEALEKIVEWEHNEQPHKNLPLADCAELARAALMETYHEHKAYEHK
jgi:hypothetical protein